MKLPDEVWTRMGLIFSSLFTASSPWGREGKGSCKKNERMSPVEHEATLHFLISVSGPPLRVIVSFNKAGIRFLSLWPA